MQEIKQFISTQDDIQSVINGIKSGMDEQLLTGLSGSARGVLATVLQDSIRTKGNPSYPSADSGSDTI